MIDDCLIRSGPTVVLAGPSVRAAAFSVLRAGLSPWRLDLFADADLQAAAPGRRIAASDYPRRLPQMLRHAPPGPLIYTGGLENHPDIVETIALDRPIWGNRGSALRRCRDPFLVARLLHENGLNAPAVEQSPTPALGRALRKPFHGAGGANIRFTTPLDRASPDYFYQQFVAGPSFAAIFCALPHRSLLLGVTEQLVGETWLHARPFHYCGSIGPVELPAPAMATLVRIGDVLASACELRGLFGVDFIRAGERIWPVEINPRYSASIETLEHATGLQALRWHTAAFNGTSPPPPTGAGAVKCVGKAVMFSPRRIVVPEQSPWQCESDPTRRPDWADVPNVGEIIEEGCPILTILTEAVCPEECRRQLQGRARDLVESLAGFSG